jgi:hypothetical protein
MGDAGLPSSLAKSIEETKVSYAQLGKSGLRVSIPILGAMSFGHKDWYVAFVFQQYSFLRLQSLLSIFCALRFSRLNTSDISTGNHGSSIHRKKSMPS